MDLIAVAAAGTVDEEAMIRTEAILQSRLGVATRRLEPLSDPTAAYDQKREQYSSTLILQNAATRVPRDAERLLVLTERDLFIPMLSFVFGQAQLDGAVAVLSFARLRQEFYGLPPNRPLFLLRVEKETLHEIGHSLGLIHCGDRRCAMALSTDIQQLDSKAAAFCERCSTRVRSRAHAEAVIEPTLEEIGGSR